MNSFQKCWVWLKVERKKVQSWNVVVVVMETRDTSYNRLFSPTSKMTWELPRKRYLLPCFLKMYKVKHPFFIHVYLSDKYKFRHHHLTEQNGRLCYLRSTYHFSLSFWFEYLILGPKNYREYWEMSLSLLDFFFLFLIF